MSSLSRDQVLSSLNFGDVIRHEIEREVGIRCVVFVQRFHLVKQWHAKDVYLAYLPLAHIMEFVGEALQAS
eukprot:1220112-Amphidinium_carterae.1